MAENEPDEAEALVEPAEVGGDPSIAPANDWLLADLVRLSNLGLAYPITLTCGGLLISGILISGRTYLDEMKGSFAGSLSGDLAEVMGSWVDQWYELYPEPKAQRNDWPSPAFIHLRDARVFAPGQTPIPTQGPGVLWRGRLSSIDGFNFGALGASQE